MVRLPKTISEITSGREFVADRVGMSDSQVLIFEDMVLKIQKSSRETENEAAMLKWLLGKLPVPELIACEKENGNSFILMSKVPGEMLCGEKYTGAPEKLVSLLAESLRRMWSIDISGCPCDNTLEMRLKEAAENVEKGLVDLDDAEPETFSEDGFDSPEALVKWLWENRPEEEPSLTHGDYSLQNIFALNGEISGYIDLGKAGAADKWQDIAICYRSLRHVFSSDKRNTGFDPDLLFEKLGVEKDQRKLKYYTLLDELF